MNLTIHAWRQDGPGQAGPLETYRAIEAQSPGARSSLVMGPWKHGGWFDAGDKLGDAEFGFPTGPGVVQLMLAFFQRHLTGGPAPQPVLGPKGDAQGPDLPTGTVSLAETVPGGRGGTDGAGFGSWTFGARSSRLIEYRTSARRVLFRSTLPSTTLRATIAITAPSSVERR